MKSKFASSLLLFFGCVLVSCGTMANKASVSTIPPSAFSLTDSGVVLLSTGAPKKCTSFASFLEVFDRASEKKVSGAPRIPVDVYVNKSDFSDHHGTVNAIHLPAGNYYVSPYVSNPYVRLKDEEKPRFAFDVKPGETTYIGELFMTAACSAKTHMVVKSSYKELFVVRDQYDRDMELATQKNPDIATRPPVKRLMQSI